MFLKYVFLWIKKYFVKLYMKLRVNWVDGKNPKGTVVLIAFFVNPLKRNVYVRVSGYFERNEIIFYLSRFFTINDNFINIY